MDELKMQQRSVIRFLTLEGSAPQEIHNRLQEVFHGSALSYTQVKFWAAETNRGRESVFSEQSSGRPKTVTNSENIEAVEKLVSSNQRIKCWDLQPETGLSPDWVIFILYEHLHIKKCSARRVLQLQTFQHSINAARSNVLQII